MNFLRIAAIILIIAGVLGLAYGNFSYTKDIRETKIGSIELLIKGKEAINIPFWTGAGAIVFGSLILLFGVKRDYC